MTTDTAVIDSFSWLQSSRLVCFFFVNTPEHPPYRQDADKMMLQPASRERNTASVKPVASLLIAGGGSFSSDYGPFVGFENRISSACLGQNLIFKQNYND